MKVTEPENRHPKWAVLALCALILAACPAHSQFLETTVWLPDSFGGLLWPQHMLYDPANGLVYVGGEVGECVSVFDPSTLEKVAKVPVGLCVSDMCLSHGGGRVWAAAGSSNTVTAIDARTNTVLGTVSVGHNPSSLAMADSLGKLYCANAGMAEGPYDSTVSVIDVEQVSEALRYAVCFRPLVLCMAANLDKLYALGVVGSFAVAISTVPDTVLYSVNIPGYTISLLYNSRERKCYIHRRVHTAIPMLDALTDSLAGEIVLEGRPLAFDYDYGVNRLYCATDAFELAVVDGETDSVLAVHAVGWTAAAVMYVLFQDLVYCANAGDGTVGVVSPDSGVVAVVPVGVWPAALCHDSLTRRVMVANSRSHNVTVIDADADTVIGSVQLGDSPRQLCHHPGQSKVYCASLHSGLVTVVDDRTNLVIANVRSGDAPAALCAIGDKLCCANEKSGDVAVIDASADSVLQTVLVGSGPAALCPAEGVGKVYCANYGLWPDQDSSVSVIDATSGRVIATAVVGNRPCAVACHPAVGKVYCANYGSATVAAIDCANDSVVAIIPVGRSPRALAVCPDQAKVYCASEWEDVVTAIDADADTVVATVSVGQQPVALCCAGGILYSANRWSGDVSVIDCRADSLIATIPVGDKPVALTYDSLHGLVYCVNSGSDDVSVIDCALNVVVATIPVGDEPEALAWSPAYGRMYVANYYGSSLSVIRDTSAAGITDFRTADALLHRRQPTIVRGTLVWSAATPLLRNVGDIALQSRAKLLDATGRVVMSLQPGPNDIRHVAPGVYFVEEGPRGQGSQGPSVRKIVIQR
ncbi:MAG: hypothetical protein JSU73_00200 [candidate division WOR-3 bacterium]|nr:MAG: hypothetical protein JSU73_00200 [candidate division WOR-3 bacterium]